MTYLIKVKLLPLNPDVKDELKDGPGIFEPDGDLINEFVKNRSRRVVK